MVGVVVGAKTLDVRGWAMRGGKTLDGRHEFADLPKFSKLMSLFPVACCNIIIHGLSCVGFLKECLWGEQGV
jgi:hypothetical protein